MRLARPFYRLPVRFDVERLRAEIAALPLSAWVSHPNEIAGNTSLRLISMGGGENDAVDGEMRPTAHLAQSAYLRQVLTSFGVVWSRSRLLRLAPGARVPEHADINYHWFNRVRLHIPIITQPEVLFTCGGETVHMAAGEAWIFDNWRLHGVENPTSEERIHLVADTSGSAAFWQLVAQAEPPDTPVRQHQYDPTWTAEPLAERTALAPIMSPAEVDLLVLDLRGELAIEPDTPENRLQLARYHAALDGFCRDWRQFYALYGTSTAGWRHFIGLRDALRATSRSLAERLIVRTNRVSAHKVLEGRVLRAAVVLPENADGVRDSPPVIATATRAADTRTRIHLSRPIFIIAAPRSGSTVLFETLASSANVCTLGGEAHWLVESLPELQPGAPGVESNRLGPEHCTDAIAARITEQILANMRDSGGQPLLAGGTAGAGHALRFLEKTPKNALRVPFFNRIFPDALFVFLWRDPQENISSIIEAWKSGRWKTYNGLDGFEGPWSLLLPPGWRTVGGGPLEAIAAYQWECTNRIVLDDLASLPRERWTALRYSDLIAQPKASIGRVCEFLRIDVDSALASRVSAPLPYSMFTLTPPQPDKWRRNEAAVLRVLPALEQTWRRLRDLT